MGGSFTGVVQITDLGDSRSFAGNLAQMGTKVAVFLDQEADLHIRSVTVFGFSAIYSQERLKLVAGKDSRVFLHPGFDPLKLLRVREACAGLGALGQGPGSSAMTFRGESQMHNAMKNLDRSIFNAIYQNRSN